MSIVVFVEDWNGAFKKASYEAVGYAKNWASMIGAKVIAVTSQKHQLPNSPITAQTTVFKLVLAKPPWESLDSLKP